MAWHDLGLSAAVLRQNPREVGWSDHSDCTQQAYKHLQSTTWTCWEGMTPAMTRTPRA